MNTSWPLRVRVSFVCFAVLGMCLAGSAALLNDNYADAVNLTWVSGTTNVSGSVFGSTNEPGEPLATSAHRQTLWWTFVAPEQGLVGLSLDATFDSRLTLFQGANFGTMIAQVPVRADVWQVQPGQEYALQVDQFYEGAVIKSKLLGDDAERYFRQKALEAVKRMSRETENSLSPPK